MADTKAPPSLPEKQQLIAERKNDVSKPAPQPRPKMIDAGLIAKREQWAKSKAAFERENRIQEIDKALGQQKGRAKSGFSRSR